MQAKYKLNKESLLPYFCLGFGLFNLFLLKISNALNAKIYHVMRNPSM